MKMIYHILGSNIPHHNNTVLTFFQQHKELEIEGVKQTFWVVTDQNLWEQFPEIDIEMFESKAAIAKGIKSLTKHEPNAKFILHGQFNFPLWFAILFGQLPAKNCVWHIWGADLYQDSTSWKFKLLYPLRRMAQNKLPELWATKGDLDFAHKLLNRNTSQDKTVYFPTKMNLDLQLPETEKNDKTTILLGNSGDQSNRHISALEQIKSSLGENVKIIIPMGYPENNQDYIEQVEQKALALFPKENINLLKDKIEFNQYLEMLSQCDLGYFNFERQQGIGTICLLAQFNIPVVLHKANPFTLDMQAESVPFILTNELSEQKIAKTQQDLTAKDKSEITFFYPNYVGAWAKLLKGL